MNKSYFIPIMMMAWGTTACERPVALDDSDPKGNVTVMVAQMEPISRAALKDVAGRLQVMVYGQDSVRIKQVVQQSDDARFGTVSMSLADGTYWLAALAHNGDGAATTTSAVKTTFADNKVTDTFCKAQKLVVSGNTSAAVNMERCVARVRVVPTDKPDGAASRIRLYYTGGSSTLNVLSGYGSVNSRQTEYRGVASEYLAYTFPHATDDVVALTVSALDKNSEVLSEQRVENVPVRVGYQTTLTGAFFGGGGSSAAGDITITVSDTPWKELTVNN